MDLRDSDTTPLMHGRRSALRAAGLGLAALGMLPLLANGTDAKRRKKHKKKASDQAPDRCLPQVAECEAVATAFCANVSDKDLCQKTLAACCQPLGTCNGGQSIQCVINAFTQKA